VASRPAGPAARRGGRLAATLAAGERRSTRVSRRIHPRAFAGEGQVGTRPPRGVRRLPRASLYRCQRFAL